VINAKNVSGPCPVADSSERLFPTLLCFSLPQDSCSASVSEPIEGAVEMFGSGKYLCSVRYRNGKAPRRNFTIYPDVANAIGVFFGPRESAL
jgi:hypothetical protein